MPRRPRDYAPGTTHHLIGRGVRGQSLFHDRVDYQLFLEMAARCLIPAGHSILAYCLMSNHVHMVLTCGDEDLSAAMQRLLLGYARHLNRRLEQNGHVFQGRHHSRHCRDEAYARQLFRYVHLNPVRAGLVSDPLDYPWSSLAAYVGGRLPIPVSTGLLGGLFSSPRSMWRLLRDPHPFEEEWLDLDELVQLQLSGPRGRGGPHLRTTPRGLEELMAEVCGQSGLSVTELSGRSRLRHVRRARRLFAERALTELGCSHAEVAAALGRSRSSVSRWLHPGATPSGLPPGAVRDAPAAAPPGPAPSTPAAPAQR